MKLFKTEDQERTVVITGAAGGMGETSCLYLAHLGWTVLAVDHNKKRLQKFEEKTNIFTLCIDLTDALLVDKVLESMNELPPLWGLVNLAGISVGDNIEKLQLEDWQLAFDVNVTAAFKLTQALSPLMKESQGGSIVNVSSPVGFIGARKPSYSASKAALQGLTMSCARNLGIHQIRVNLLIPGTTITHMTKDWSVERQQAIADEVLLKRLCTPQEVAESIAFLLSEHSRYMSGSVLDMSCGSMWGH